MKVLVIGGTKFIGRVIAERFLAQGCQVTLFNRGTRRLEGCSLIHGDVDTLLQHRHEVNQLKPDVVVHCIAFTEQHASDLANIFARSSARVMVLSSADGYDAFQQLNRGVANSDFPIDESMPKSPIRYYWREFGNHAGGEMYDKNLMTDALFQGFRDPLVQPTVFRLPQVYGPRDVQYPHRHGPIIRRLMDRRLTYVMSDLEAAQLQTFGYVENIAAAIVHAVSNEATRGQIYNLGERKVRTRRRWAELYAAAYETEFKFELVPSEILSTPPRTKKPPAQHLIFDCQKFYHDTGFVDPVDVNDCVSRTLKWAVENQTCLGPRPDYDEEDRRVLSYKTFLTSIE